MWSVEELHLEPPGTPRPLLPRHRQAEGGVVASHHLPPFHLLLLHPPALTHPHPPAPTEGQPAPPWTAEVHPHLLHLMHLLHLLQPHGGGGEANQKEEGLERHGGSAAPVAATTASSRIVLPPKVPPDIPTPPDTELSSPTLWTPQQLLPFGNFQAETPRTLCCLVTLPDLHRE